MSPFCKVKVSPFVGDGGVLLVSREGMLGMREPDRAGVIGQVAEKRLRLRNHHE